MKQKLNRPFPSTSPPGYLAPPGQSGALTPPSTSPRSNSPLSTSPRSGSPVNLPPPNLSDFAKKLQEG